MKRSAELYACVCVREFPAQALLRLRPELKDRACVVMAGEVPFEEVCSLNTKSRLLGIKRGMAYADIDRFPQAKIFSRSLKTESTTKQLLLECAGTYSPRLEDCSDDTYFLCAIDIAGTEYVFGPPEVLARQLRQHIQSLGLSAQVKVSNNFHTAMCLAKASSGRSGDVVQLGEEATFLSELPLNALSLTDEHAQIFALWGVHTLGMLAALPEKELIARIGQDGRRLQQLARGEWPHLFQPIKPSFRLEERHELDFPLDSLESLMFCVAVLLSQLIFRAKTRLTAIAAVTVILELEDGETYIRRVRRTQPGNDKQSWLRLLHLDLQSHPPQKAAVAVTLQAEPGNTSTIQLGIFSPPLPEAAKLDVTIARLKSLLGDDNVGHVILQDSYTPDSFRLEPFRLPASFNMSPALQNERTVVRQLRPPETTSVRPGNTRPGDFTFREQCFSVESAYGPWMFRGEWWTEMSWDMEQWDVIARAPNDAMLYCCIAHNVLRNEWQVIALYD